MIEFNELVSALAIWRAHNGQAASAPLIVADVAAPVAEVVAAVAAAPSPRAARTTAPPPPRPKAASIPPPIEYTDVPEDAIEEDGNDFEMSFNGSAPPPLQAPRAIEVEEVHSDDGFGDSDATVVGGGGAPDRDRH